MIKQKPLEQAHLCVGFEGVAAGHKDRYAVYALNAVLGGSVSSRLFQEIREKRGLSYSIYSFLSGYSDSGTITVYVGIRAREVERVLDLVYREIRKLTRHGIDGHELKRTQDQMKGSLMLSLESSHSRMNKLAKDELIAGTHTTLDDLIKEIDGVTEQQVFQIAQNLLIGDRIALTGLGPLSSRQMEDLGAKFS
jgi:predicted Zn-dependent peptidase